MYVCRVGNDVKLQAVLGSFIRAAGYMQGQLGLQLTLRYASELLYQFEAAIACSVCVAHLLHDLVLKRPLVPLESDSSHV